MLIIFAVNLHYLFCKPYLYTISGFNDSRYLLAFRDTYSATYKQSLGFGKAINPAFYFVSVRNQAFVSKLRSAYS